MFIFALPTNPCLILCCTTIHPIRSSQLYLLLYTTLLKQNNPSIILPTFRYTILRLLSTMLPFPTSTTLCYMLHFSTLQLQTILLYHFLAHQTTFTLYFQLDYAIHYIPQLSLSIYHTNLYIFTCMLLCDLLQCTILPSGNTTLS